VKAPKVIIRAFRSSDAPALTQTLHRAHADWGQAGLNVTAVDQDSPRRGGVLKEAALFGRAWLNQLAVEPGSRGRGIARRLPDIAD